jgi:hypothetical protein
MALAPHGDWHQIVLAALDDPSERVCVAALEIVAANRWDAAAPRVEQLASSPRPELRRCALAALQDLGRVVKPREYGDCVMRAASRLADQLAEIGVDFELSEIVGGQRSGALDFEELNRAAEAYLDRAPDSASSVRDFQGILFLAAAARVQQRKLTLRLWEHEIARADSDAELLDHGLQTVARAQLLAGLAALRRGDQTAGLQAIASVARLARSATPHSPLQVYVKQASHLSSAIWQATTTNASEPGSTVAPRASDSVTQVVVRVLGKLDLSRLEHNEEARRRLDEWCELDTHTPTRSHNAYQPVAN